MSLAFNEVHGVVLWGSEASAQSVLFLKIRSPTNVPTLEEDGGEIVEVRVVSDFEALSTEMAHWTASNNVRDVFHSRGVHLDCLF